MVPFSFDLKCDKMIMVKFMEVMFEYKLDGEKYNVLVSLKNNKNTYIKIKDDLTIYVTTNYLTTKRQVKVILDNEKDFLRSVIAKTREKQIKEKEFYYLGKRYDVIYAPFDEVTIDGEKIFVKNKSKLDKWLLGEARRIFQERLEINYNFFQEDIPFPKLKIRNMKTRWGVCNKRDDSVTLNFKLIKYDVREIDYVIIHELSHFVHFDHSKDFWNTVFKYMPNYKKSVKILKN